ncbi:hypothetical protein, partial [Streptomyces noursei]
ARETAHADKDAELAELREEERKALDGLLDAYEGSGHKRSELDPKREREENEDRKNKTNEEEFRKRLDNATHIPPREYDSKHWKGKTESERKNASMNGGPGQFMASMTEAEVKRLERDALLTGKRVTKAGVTYGWKRFDRQIGWANGKPAFTLRAEMTTAVKPSIHSHPRLEMD